jgi:CubicO group peptidase (beta-lactamase class C family)
MINWKQLKFTRRPFEFCLLFILTLQATPALNGGAASSQAWKDRTDVEERIRRVESGLLKPFQIKGETLETMNLAERMKRHRVPGISIAVINNGKIEWARGYGVKEAGTKLPVTPDTLFQAASISKAVAAVAALKMVQAGELSLDEDVNEKLVSWKVPQNEFTRERKVTLRDLLSHGAGLNVSGFPGYRSDTKTLPTVLQILDGSAPANTKPVRVEETPGSRWSYSGGGITAMQQLATDVAGKPFPALMKESVLKRIGMNNSTFEYPLPKEFREKVAVGHDGKGEVIPGKWHLYPEMAAAGLWTTPTDLARFAVELQQAYAGKSKKSLSPEIAKQMFTKQIGSWGLGVSLAGTGTSARFSHGGSNEGYRCSMIAYLENGQGAIIMTNSHNGDALVDEVFRSIAKEYGWTDFLAKEKTVIELDAKSFDKYVGKYQLGTAGQFTVLSEDGKLKIQLRGETKYELLPESETHFFAREMPLEVTFVKDESGRVVEMINIYNGQEFRLRKV